MAIRYSILIVVVVVVVAAITNCDQATHVKPSNSNDEIVTGFEVPKVRALKELKKGHGYEFAGFIVHGQIVQVQAKIRVDRPNVYLPHHSSSALISIESGSGSNFNQIQVGWTVSPDLYGDNQVHLFTNWKGDNNIGCFDTKCPGFIQINKTIALGSRLTPSKVGAIKEVFVKLEQDMQRNWWFYAGPKQVRVGYWDKKHLSSLSHLATTVRLGGEVFTPWNSNISPPMGSGYLLYSYFFNVLVNDEDPPQDVHIVKSRCYYVGMYGRGKGLQGYGFFFGGPGGKQEDCQF